MTTYEQGRAPEGAPYTYDLDCWGFVRLVYRSDGTKDEDLSREIETPRVADRVLNAMHVAKLAEDYAKAKAALDAAATASEMESVRAAYYDAARALCEAVR